METEQPVPGGDAAAAVEVAAGPAPNVAELALLEEGRALARQVEAFVSKVGGTPRAPVPDPVKQDLPSHDPRWLAIAEIDLQKGFLALRLAITRPAGF